jgi:Helix-turn-helix
MSNDSRPGAGGYATGGRLTDAERRLLARDHQRANAPKVDVGRRSVQADSASTVIGYLRELRGLTIEAASRRAGITPAELERLEAGTSTGATLLGSQKSRLAATFGRSSFEDLLRPITDEGVKAAALHGLPMKEAK